MSDLSDPAVRRRNIKLGLVVGGVAFGIMAFAVIKFTLGGLPKDRQAYERLQQQASAQQGGAVLSCSTRALA